MNMRNGNRGSMGTRLAGGALPLALALVLGGCSLLGGGPKEAATIYAPDPRIQADPSWPQVGW